MNTIASVYPKDAISRIPVDVSVNVKKMEEQDYDKVSKYWFADNAIASLSVDLFSIYIPRGEKFFIKSVRYFEGKVEDPELRRDIKAFIKQEANHYQAHQIFNDSLDGKGIGSQREQQAAEKLFSFMEKWLPKKIQLGITVFDEHLTASGAKIFLQSKSLKDVVEPEKHKLWSWHAVEEIEHKSVAYDVYEAMGAGYFHRMTSALIGSVLQGVALFLSGSRVFKQEGVSRFGKDGKAARKLVATHIKGKREIVKEFMMYFKPGYHPWQVDDRPLLNEWYRTQK